MSASIVIDTHVMVWHFLSSPRLSSKAIDAIDSAINSGDTIYIASISVIEVIYLIEKGKLPQNALDRMIKELNDPNSIFEIYSLDFNVAQAMRNIKRDIVPDMPDRIISATAFHLNLPLVTCDPKIQLSGIRTIW